MLLNARSVLPKFDELCVLASTLKPIVIGVTESWLTPDVPSTLLYLPDYSLARNDRVRCRGGGTCIWYRREMNICQYAPTYIMPECIEVSWIVCTQERFLLCCAYTPPALTSAQKSSVSQYFMDYFDEFLLTYNRSSCLAILG